MVSAKGFKAILLVFISVLTVLSSLASNCQPQGTVDLNGTLYAIGLCFPCPNRFGSLDPSTGVLTPLNPNVGDINYGFSQGLSGLDPNTHTFYLIRWSDATASDHLISINTTTGALTDISGLTSRLSVLELDPGTNILYGVTNCCPNQFVSINASTGALLETLNSDVGGLDYGFSQGISVIDPSTDTFCFVRSDVTGGATEYHLISIDTGTGIIKCESPAMAMRDVPCVLEFEPD